MADSHLPKSPPGPQTGPNGMAPEELSDLRVLCAAESSSPYRDASLYSIEDMSPHARLRLRLVIHVSFLQNYNNLKKFTAIFGRTF